MLISRKEKHEKQSVRNKLKNGFYFPAEEDYKIAREANIKIVHQDGKVEISNYSEIIGPFYWDVNDYVSAKSREKILSKRKEKQSVIVGVPTYNSYDHIRRYLIGDKNQRDLFSQLKVIKESHPDWQVELVIAVTTFNKADKTELLIREIQKEARQFFPSIEVTLITMPFRTKVNAMNVTAEYAKKKEATILCFVDDDTLHHPKNALLDNIETLLSSDDLSIVAPRYDPGPPTSMWERMRSIRWRYHINKTIPGESMVLDVASYPKIPFYLNSDDLYLTAYFLDVNHVNPLRRVIVNKNSIALSRIAGDKILDGLKVLLRSVYGINQLLSFLPSEKKYYIRKMIMDEPVFCTLKLIESEGVVSDAFLFIISGLVMMPVFAIIKIELTMRQCLNIPKKTIIYDRDSSTTNPIE